MSFTIGAFLSGLAVTIPLLDQAIKDSNYKQVKYYQKVIDALMSKYNITMTQLNNALSKYQTKYGEAVDMIRSSVRGSVQHKAGMKMLSEAKTGIESTQQEIADKSKQFEAAANAIKSTQSQYENKGLIDTITQDIGNINANVKASVTGGKDW